ncbi:uncharacterized protein LOC107610838 [Arachis ipaensis]|uniref:uncharacterized protein LOC107610838 n=1 Tax=Arachis ipaensis TaxID=130454 RepID=UPI0007AF2A61|nr:uncharacterized protein LOC107610838 [Arachis ipaensis]XP_025670099.1 uncharacterized protein LOC112769858 [Arachis hypogaea]
MNRVRRKVNFDYMFSVEPRDLSGGLWSFRVRESSFPKAKETVVGAYGAQEEEIYQLIHIINKYTEASGQRINTDKSGLIFGRQVPIQRRVNIEEITGMNSWEDSGRYLGLPARWRRSKNKALEWIQEKILDKMQGWKEKLLNQAGKEVLIKAVIQAIPVYAMNIIKFSKSFCKRIEAAIARFW